MARLEKRAWSKELYREGEMLENAVVYFSAERVTEFV